MVHNFAPSLASVFIFFSFLLFSSLAACALHQKLRCLCRLLRFVSSGHKTGNRVHTGGIFDNNFEWQLKRSDWNYPELLTIAFHLASELRCSQPSCSRRLCCLVCDDELNLVLEHGMCCCCFLCNNWGGCGGRMNEVLGLATDAMVKKDDTMRRVRRS